MVDDQKTKTEQPITGDELPQENRKPWKRFVRRHRVALVFALCLLVIYIIIPPVWRLRSGPIEIVRWPKSGQMVFKVGPGTATWVPIKTVSRHVLYAIIVAEDGKFYEHNGLDYEEIVKSFHLNMAKGRYVRGASTLSQQVVKMAFLSNEKSIIRKAREVIGTLIMEKILTKDQILEWYINMAEFGDGVFGIKAAAKHYFSTKPELLTIQHGANLALVLPSPNAWSKGLRQKRLTKFGHRRFAQIIDLMRANGYITDSLRMSALATGDFGRPVDQYRKVMAQIEALQAAKRAAEGPPADEDPTQQPSPTVTDVLSGDAPADLQPKAIAPAPNAEELQRQMDEDEAQMDEEEAAGEPASQPSP